MRIRLSLLAVTVAAALFAPIAGAAVVPPNPPGGSGVVVPPWWNDQTTPFWSYHHEVITGGGTTTTEESNNGEFGTELIHNTNELLVTVNMRNGYSATLFKRFFFYFEGTTTASADPSFVSIQADNNGAIPDSQVNHLPGFQADTNTTNQTWYAAFTGTATPQPDWIYFKFNLPSGTSTVTQWWVGEECLVPEPASLCSLSLAALMLLRRRA